MEEQPVLVITEQSRRLSSPWDRGVSDRAYLAAALIFCFVFLDKVSLCCSIGLAGLKLKSSTCLCLLSVVYLHRLVQF